MANIDPTTVWKHLNGGVKLKLSLHAMEGVQGD